MSIDIEARFSVEQIENGWVVRDVGNARAVHVAYRWDVARQVERFMHDAAVGRFEAWADIEEQAKLDREARPMQQVEA